MAKIIQQETFDAIIKENIVEFSMSLDEAREETISQFEAQGINLANIIKDLDINEETGNTILNEAIEGVKNHVESTKRLDDTQLNATLEALIKELNKSVPHRVLASKSCTQEYLLKIMEDEVKKNETNHAKDSILHKTILCAHAITNKNPDIFNEKSLRTINKILDTEKNEHIVCDILKWIQKACLLHELNRQMIVNEELLITHLKPLLLGRKEIEIVRNVCTCLRYLILDDDIRVEFGKAHEHARLIAHECLSDLTLLLTEFKENPDVLAELMLTIAALCVRNEFCQVVAEANGIVLIMDAMVTFHDSLKVIRESMKLLKALGGNDKVKVDIIKSGAASIIESSFNRHKADEVLAKNALACITTLSLRSKDNSTAFFESGIAETILEAMKIHAKSQVVQRNAAWAIRNMVSRSREQCEGWISLGIEDILKTAAVNHPSLDQDLRYAARDLGLQVKLKEEWKGTADKAISNE
ncbi:unnamed protein product [Chironomus riparius]|uniref:Armadillo repeat-containing protein 6 n=1 Tax=Chironomus riparius TaxID=315576 RepID=A0A9N9S6G2_9DIPT|nr:unnamed protein product [Chironomus riparius]